MPDREMIVKWFEFCRVADKCSTNCPYWDNKGGVLECTKKLAKDVLTLLNGEVYSLGGLCQRHLKLMILMSIKPKWCDLIFSGKKIDEIRKTKPQLSDGLKYTVYVYQTGGGIVGKFTVQHYTFIQAWKDRDGEKHLGNIMGLRHCLKDEELFKYLYREEKDGKPYPGGWAWRIENPVKFKAPIPLRYFGLKRPPQSWQYIPADSRKEHINGLQEQL